MAQHVIIDRDLFDWVSYGLTVVAVAVAVLAYQAALHARSDLAEATAAQFDLGVLLDIQRNFDRNPLDQTVLRPLVRRFSDLPNLTEWVSIDIPNLRNTFGRDSPAFGDREYHDWEASVHGKIRAEIDAAITARTQGRV